MNSTEQQGRSSSGSSGLRAAAVCCALVVIVFTLYGQVARHEFVNWDDDVYIYKNPYVSAGVTAEGVTWAFGAFHSANWHPLTWLSHMLDVELFGLDPAGHHLVNVGLHAINAVLLFLALRMMTGCFWTSAFVAALFAVHPQRVESVAWAAERKDVLSGLFWMLAMLAYGWYAKRESAGRYVAVFAAVALGLLAKPMLVTLPMVLLLLDLWPLRRWRFPGGENRDATTRSLGRLILEKVPLLALSATSSAVTVLAQRQGGSLTMEAWTMSVRVATAMNAYVAYLWKTLWPTGLACFYPHKIGVAGSDYRPWTLGTFGAMLLLLVLTALAMLSIRRRPYFTVGWLWYVGTLVPVIGLFQIGGQSTADRYTYIPLVGIYIIVAWGAAELVGRVPAMRPAFGAAAVAALVALALVTGLRQVGTWRNGRVLFEHCLEVTKKNSMIHNNLGNIYLRDNDLNRAAEQYEKALSVNPNYAKAHNNLGVVYMRQGDLYRARQMFERSLALNPNRATTYNSLGAVLANQGDLAGAVVQFERALELNPDHGEARKNLERARTMMRR